MIWIVLLLLRLWHSISHRGPAIGMITWMVVAVNCCSSSSCRCILVVGIGIANVTATATTSAIHIVVRSVGRNLQILTVAIPATHVIGRCGSGIPRR